MKGCEILGRKFKIIRNYWEKDQILYRKANIEINPGLTVLVGCNGSGKTTLLDILLGLYNDEERKIIDGKSEFSGGERQKIALVRLFIKTADVLLLDEPTSALDVMSKERVMDYLQDIKQDKIIIIISHDWEIAELCDKVVKI